MKDIKLIRLEPFTDEDEFGNNRAYLYLKYEYKDDNGNTRNRIIPLLGGLILHETNIVTDDEKAIALENVNMVDIITKRAVKKRSSDIR